MRGSAHHRQLGNHTDARLFRLAQLIQQLGDIVFEKGFAVRIKEAYTIISQPENGWDPPECLEENFDSVVLDALKFYFKLLNWKLFANKNAFKEAEILFRFFE